MNKSKECKYIYKSLRGRLLMGFLICSATGVASADVGRSQDSWIRSLLQSKHAQTTLKSVEKKASARSLQSTTILLVGPASHDSVPLPLTPAEQALWAEASRAQVTASRLLRAGRVEDAHTFIAGYIHAHPDAWEMDADAEIESSLLLGKYGEAYGQLVRLFSETGTDSPVREVELSMAAAGLGEVYPGQLKFVTEQVGSFYAEQHPSQMLPDKVAIDSTPKGVLLTSCLALAMRGGPSEQNFLDLMLRMEPSNVLAGRQSVELLGWRGQYSELRRIAGDFTERLPEGSARDYFVRAAVAVKGLKDKVQGALPPP